MPEIERRNGDMDTTRGSRPVPDPTELTDKAITRLERSMKEYVDGQIAVRDERLSGIDEATKLRLAGVEGIPKQIDTAVGHLAELTTERFDAAERLRIEQKKDTKDAVDAALSAAKEAVKEQTTASGLSISKSEAATSKQLEQQQQTFTTAIEGLRRSIDDLKEARAEDARGLRQSISDLATTVNGTGEHRSGSREGVSDVRVIALFVLSVLVAALAIYGALKP